MTPRNMENWMTSKAPTLPPPKGRAMRVDSAPCAKAGMAAKSVARETEAFITAFFRRKPSKRLCNKGSRTPLPASNDCGNIPQNPRCAELWHVVLFSATRP